MYSSFLRTLKSVRAFYRYNKLSNKNQCIREHQIKVSTLRRKLIKTSFAQFDGPRLVRRDELIASEHLARLCFGGSEIENEEEILARYVPPRRGGAYVLAHAGQPVSQIAIFHDQIKMYDGLIRAGSIGKRGL